MLNQFYNFHKTLSFIILISSFGSASAEVKQASIEIKEANAGITNAQINDIDTERKLTDYKYYSVEVILFRHNDSNSLTSEFWVPFQEDDIEDNEANLIEEDNKITAIPLMPQFGIPGATQAPASHFELGEYFREDNKFNSYDSLVSQLDKELMQLSAEAAHLRYSKSYQVITHFGWVQPGYDAETTLPIKLNLPLRYGDIKGTIKVSLARYLHTAVDLTLVEEICRKVKKMPDDINLKVKVLLQPEKVQTEKAVDDKSAAFNPDKDKTKAVEEEYGIRCQMEIIPFKQSRKMRSKKLHYIDHPAFGLLVIINPYKLPEDNKDKDK